MNSYLVKATKKLKPYSNRMMYIRQDKQKKETQRDDSNSSTASFKKRKNGTVIVTVSRPSLYSSKNDLQTTPTGWMNKLLNLRSPRIT
jgi:hypothetical protein